MHMKAKVSRGCRSFVFIIRQKLLQLIVTIIISSLTYTKKEGGADFSVPLLFVQK